MLLCKSRKAFGVFALSFCFWLGACGFSPLYQQKDNVLARIAAVDMGNIPDRDGQYLRNRLIDRLYGQGQSDSMLYKLKIDPLQTVLTDLGIQQDATVTRTEIEISAHITLTEKDSGRVLLDRKLQAVGGYDVLDNQYATVVTRQNVKEHILDELADSITLALTLRLREEK